MKMAFIIDPIAQFNVEADTSFAFMLAAQQRGHEVWITSSEELSAEGSRAYATLRPCHDLQRVQGEHYRLGEPVRLGLDEMDVIFMRKDPPFDVAYLHACHLLELAERRGALVVNRPTGLRVANEKLFALHFEAQIPRTLVTRSLGEVHEFLRQEGGRCVIKPVDGHGGEGVFVLEEGDRNLNALLEMATRGGRDYLICQSYLPGAREGDKRILMLDGEPMGAIMRVPREDEHRGNIHVGGRVEKTTLSEADRSICEAVGPMLSQAGLWFVGLDVIGGRLTEVNVTSPTGIQEMSRLDGVDGAGQVIAWAEDRRGRQKS